MYPNLEWIIINHNFLRIMYYIRWNNSFLPDIHVQSKNVGRYYVSACWINLMVCLFL